jgi:hypothetical protein
VRESGRSVLREGVGLIGEIRDPALRRALPATLLDDLS